MDNIGDLPLLIASRHPIVAIESAEEERVREHAEAAALAADLPFFEWKATSGLRRAGTTDPIYETEKPAQALKTVTAMRTDGVFLFYDLHKFFEDPALLRSLRDFAQSEPGDRRTIVLCGAELELPVDLRACAAFIRLELPDLEALKGLTLRTLRGLGAPSKIRIALSLPEIEQLVASLRGLTLAEAQRALVAAALDDLTIDRDDLKRILKRKTALIARDGVLELCALDASLQQIGGLESLKSWLRSRGAGFAPDAKKFGLEPPRGILLLGVQGCGKSLCAKAVASEWDLALLRLDAGALYDKYVGQTEKNLRAALRTAEAMAPCVLWIDEIEKGMSGTGGSESDGGLSRRMFGAFLSWLQERRSPVFVAATANDIQALPPELLRKGRFDEIFFVDLPSEPARRAVLAVHLARRGRDPGTFDLGGLAAASEGWSGAEIEAAIVAALYAAYAAKRPLATAHVLAEMKRAVPLSSTCREKIDGLRAWARGRAVPADAAGDPARSTAA